MQAVPSLLGLALPSRCAACDAWGSGPLCAACETEIRWFDGAVCDSCGLPAAPRSDSRDSQGSHVRRACRRCRDHQAAFDRVRTACVYEGPAREALKAFKLLGERRTARWLAGRILRVTRDLNGDVVTWVPASRAAESARGFNPAEELARPLARSLRLPARRLLVKRRDTLDSAGLSKEQRKINLLDAFRAKGAIAGHILLVDDIFTTGATADECAKALKLAGGREVSVVAFARAP